MRNRLFGALVALCVAVPLVALAALASFTPTSEVILNAKTTTANVAISATGTPTQVIVTNFGPSPAFVVLGAAGVTATVATGMPVMPGTQSVVLALGTNTNLAAITASGTATLHISAGK